MQRLIVIVHFCFADKNQKPLFLLHHFISKTITPMPITTSKERIESWSYKVGACRVPSCLSSCKRCKYYCKGYVIKTSSTEEGSSLEELERSVLDLPTLYTQVAVAGSKAPINDQHDFRIEKRHRYWRQWLFRSRWPIIGVKKKCWEAEENINWRKLILQDSPDYYSKAISFEDHNNEQCQWLISMIC